MTTTSKYFSTFVSGLGEVVCEALNKSVPDLTTELLLDGLVVWGANVDFGRVRQLRFFNNSFVLLESVKANGSNEALKKLVEVVIKDTISIPFERRTSFRIMFSKENQPVSVGEQTLQVLEKKFASRDFSVNRTNPGVELLFLSRKDGYGFFGMRLTRHRDYKKTLHAGELRPELANLLCFLSEPKDDDVFLDPFAGYGAVPIQRATAWPYKKIYAGEIDSNLVVGIKQKISKFGKRLIVGKWDATNLTEFQDASVDKVVTDPPWGIYSGGESLGKLYVGMFREVERVLRPSGILVLLTANKELTDLYLSKFHELKLQKSYDILVSGKKATVYKFVR